MSTFYHRFLEHANRLPQNIALEIQRRDRVESFTYGQLKQMAESVARWLALNGFPAGSRMAILADNHPRWVAAYLGIIASGHTAVPLDTAFYANQITKLLKDSGSSLLFCDVKHISVARDAVADLPVGLVLMNPFELGASSPEDRWVADLDTIFTSSAKDFE